MSIVKVEAHRVVCDRCGEHDGEYYDSPYGITEDELEPGWTIREDGAFRCVSCNEEDRQLGCAAGPGHEFDTPGNQNLAKIWAGQPEFRLRHCGHGCGRTEMQQRGGQWFGFDRYGWIGDSQNIRAERRRMRDEVFKLKGKDSCDA